MLTDWITFKKSSLNGLGLIEIKKHFVFGKALEISLQKIWNSRIISFSETPFAISLSPAE